MKALFVFISLACLGALFNSCDNRASQSSAHPSYEPMLGLYEGKSLATVDFWLINAQLDSMFKDSIISKSELDSVRLYIESMNNIEESFQQLWREMISEKEGIQPAEADTFSLWLMQHHGELVEYSPAEMNAVAALTREVDSLHFLIPVVYSEFVPGRARSMLFGQNYYDAEGDSLTTWEVVTLRNRRMEELLFIYPAVQLRIRVHKNTMVEDFIDDAHRRSQKQAGVE